jgi:hypothetical protein
VGGGETGGGGKGREDKEEEKREGRQHHAISKADPSFTHSFLAPEPPVRDRNGKP